MAEAEHVAATKDRTTTAHADKAPSKGTRSKVFIPAGLAPNGPGYRAWSLTSDEVEATVLAELRL